MEKKTLLRLRVPLVFLLAKPWECINREILWKRKYTLSKNLIFLEKYDKLFPTILQFSYNIKDDDILRYLVNI